MLGLSVMVSLFDSASSLADVVDDTSTCVNSVGPTGQPGATMWWVLWHAVITTSVVVVAILAYTVWLIRYAGMRIPQETADACTQVQGAMIDRTRRLLGQFWDT